MVKQDMRYAVRAMLERTILQHVVRNGTVSADDVRKIVVIPPEIDPRIVGAVFLALMRDGWIIEIGSLHTRRSVAHARMVRVWVLAVDHDRVAARLAQPAPDWPIDRPTQRGLFDNLDDAPEMNAGGTTGIVPPAAISSLNPQHAGEHHHGSIV